MSKFLEHTSQKCHVLPIPRLHSTVLPTYAPQTLLQKQLSLMRLFREMASAKIILQQKIHSKCYARTTTSTRNNKTGSLCCLTIFRKRGNPHHQGVISFRGRQKAVCDILGSYLKSIALD